MLNLWVGIASIIVSVFAVVILYLTRANILDILDKDVILFDKNFELKKNAIDSALKLIDEIDEKGKDITLRPDIQQNAKAIYNDLLCVASDVRVADEFYSIVLEDNSEVNATRLAQFKLMCRHDIGLKTKKAKAVKRILEKQNQAAKEKTPNQSSFSSFQTNETLKPKSIETTQPARPVQPQVFASQTQARPTQPAQIVNTNQTQAPKVAQPVRPAVARPVQPVKPTSTQVAKPAVAPATAQPVKKVGRPRKTN